MEAREGVKHEESYSGSSDCVEFAVCGKAGKYSGCVIVVKQLSAKFQIQLVIELSDTLHNVF